MESFVVNWLVSDLPVFGLRAQNWMLVLILFFAMYFAYVIKGRFARLNRSKAKWRKRKNGLRLGC